MIREIVNSIHPVSEKSLIYLEELIVIEEYEQGESFIKINSRNNKEYFVIDGICKSYLENPDGDEITISFFKTNDVLSPYITRTSKDLSILNFKALTRLRIASMDAERFLSLMIENIEIRDFGNAVLRNELMNKVRKEIGLASLTAKERLLEFRDHYPLFENIIPHTDIASYLGITNISLSRLRKELLF